MASCRSRLLVALAAALVLLMLATPAGATVLGPRPSHSPNADHIRTAYWVMLAVATVLVILVNAGLVIAITRFRDQRERRPARFTAGPGVFRRAAAPLALVAAAIFVFGIVETTKVRDVQPSGPNGLQASRALTAQVGLGGVSSATSEQGEAAVTGQVPAAAAEAAKGGPLQLNAVGQQWLWRFEYPIADQQGPPYSIFSYNELVVPVDTAVILNITATDVTHRWFVPALGGQVDAVPGHVTQTWFRADSEGTYPGQSTSFSGSAYSAMRAWVRVVSADEYQSFIHQKESEISSAQADIERKIQRQATVGGVTLP